jgi:hypothetical protein
VTTTITWLDLDLTSGDPAAEHYRMTGHCTNCGARPLHALFDRGVQAFMQGECPGCGCHTLHWTELAPAAEFATVTGCGPVNIPYSQEMLPDTPITWGAPAFLSATSPAPEPASAPPPGTVVHVHIDGCELRHANLARKLRNGARS